MEKFQTATLANGLKIIYEPSSSAVAYCGYVINAATRNEEPDEEGMAHFIEHTTFKGTSRRDSWHVSNALESVGGDLNAYTSKEETVYYTAIVGSELPRAIDVLSDMVFHSVYPQREINKEVEVISDEIESYRDNPAELIFDDFEEILYKGHPLGRNILGNAERLHTYTTADALNFTSRFYLPSNATFFVYGKADFGKIVKLLEKHTAGLSARQAAKAPQPLPPYKPQEIVRDKHTHQAHVIMGARSYSATDDRHLALFLLNNILGGPAMSSRLNVILREHSGLVYTVESFTSAYSDTGVWGIYFGCDGKDVARCRRLITRELYRFTSQALTPTRLAAGKKQRKGQMLISCNNFESFAIGIGRNYAKYGLHRTIEEQCRRIDALTADELLDAAQKIAPNELTTLIYK